MCNSSAISFGNGSNWNSNNSSTCSFQKELSSSTSMTRHDQSILPGGCYPQQQQGNSGSFKNLDTNHDGYVSRNEAQQAFRKADGNGDCNLNRDEFNQFNGNSRRSDSNWQSYDRNGDGYVSRDEVCDAFAAADTNGDGKLSRDEFNQFRRGGDQTCQPNGGGQPQPMPYDNGSSDNTNCGSDNGNTGGNDTGNCGGSNRPDRGQGNHHGGSSRPNDGRGHHGGNNGCDTPPRPPVTTQPPVCNQPAPQPKPPVCTQPMPQPKPPVCNPPAQPPKPPVCNQPAPQPMPPVCNMPARPINGTCGNDTLNGTSRNDTINGGAGNDIIKGGAGNDKINGGAGNDAISGGAGNDTIKGGAGNDVIDGDCGNDKISGGKGDDVIRGGAGNDKISGGAGKDAIDGGAGCDTINAGKGNDWVDGGAGNDKINGGAGDDNLLGGAGNDKINGGTGNDFIDGGAGNDKLNGGKGNDVIVGGEGNDTITGGKGNDWIDGGAGCDTSVYGGNRDDYKVYTKDGKTYVVGKDGTDTLSNVENLKFGDKTMDVPAEWKVSDVKDGKATISLGDRYSISLNEANSTWTLTDNCDKSQTRVWGDPHVDVGNDGSTDFNFKKDASFQLEDGTKITVGTTPFGTTGQTLSSTLTITNGDNAIKVSGLGMTYDGANNLKVEQSYDGKTVDAATPDGAFTAKEAGKGWTIDGQAATQAVVNQKEAAAV